MSDSMAHRSPAEDPPHPERLLCWKGYREVRKTAKTWLLSRGQPAGRKALRPLQRGRHRGPRGQSKRTPAPAWDAFPFGVGMCRVDGPARGLGATRGVTAAGSGYGPQGRTRQTPNGATPVPAPRSTRERKCATGCGITVVPTARGIPRLRPWERGKALFSGRRPPAAVGSTVSPCRVNPYQNVYRNLLIRLRVSF